MSKKVTPYKPTCTNYGCTKLATLRENHSESAKAFCGVECYKEYVNINAQAIVPEGVRFSSLSIYANGVAALSVVKVVKIGSDGIVNISGLANNIDAGSFYVRRLFPEGAPISFSHVKAPSSPDYASLLRRGLGKETTVTLKFSTGEGKPVVHTGALASDDIRHLMLTTQNKTARQLPGSAPDADPKNLTVIRSGVASITIKGVDAPPVMDHFRVSFDSGGDSVPIEYGYMLSGLSWSFRYELIMDKSKSANLVLVGATAYAVVQNNSGVDFADINVKLVEGVPNRVGAYTSQPNVEYRKAMRSYQPNVEYRKAMRSYRKQKKRAYDASSREDMPRLIPVASAPGGGGGSTDTSETFESHTLDDRQMLDNKATSALFYQDLSNNIGAEIAIVYDASINVSVPLLFASIKNNSNSSLPSGLLTVYENTESTRSMLGSTQLERIPGTKKRESSIGLASDIVVARKFVAGKFAQRDIDNPNVLVATDRIKLTFMNMRTTPERIRIWERRARNTVWTISSSGVRNLSELKLIWTEKKSSVPDDPHRIVYTELTLPPGGRKLIVDYTVDTTKTN